MTTYPMFGLVKEVFEHRCREKCFSRSQRRKAMQFVYVGESERSVFVPILGPDDTFAEEPEGPPVAAPLPSVEIKLGRWIEVLTGEFEYRFYWAIAGERVYVIWRQERLGI